MATLSVWQAEAKRRWPGASVEGDGQFAMVSTCSKLPHIMLFHFAVEARNGMNEQCKNAFCRGTHSAFQLQPKPQVTGYQPVSCVGYGRD